MKTEKPGTFTTDDTASAKAAAEEKAAKEGTLREAGDARRDDLARKAEEMIAQAEAILREINVESADPSMLTIENEVRAALNELNEVYVSNAKFDEFAYCWIFRDPHNEFGGRQVRAMQALGYEVVQGEMREAIEHRFVDGTRVVSDCLLMRIKIERKRLLEKRDWLLRQAQQAGITSRIHDLAERAGTRVFDKLPDFVADAMESEADRRRTQVRQHALRDFHRMNQHGNVDRMLKTGSIPGIPVPGAGRG